MNIEEVLNLPVFKKSKLLTPEFNLDQPVESVMVLEATDIEHWGRKNELILTSFYALEDLDETELQVFFEKLKSIGIAGLIVKINRLIDLIPEWFIDLCKEYEIPLIKISKETSYERILISIYEPILNHQSQILRTYYEANRRFSAMDKSNVEFEKIVEELHQLLAKCTELEIPEKNLLFYKGEQRYLEETKQISKVEIESEFTQNRYDMTAMHDSKSNHITYVLHTRVNNTMISDFYINVYQDSPAVNEADLMIIENAVHVIKHKLQFDYLMKKETFIRLNNLAASILQATSRNTEEYDSFLKEANLTEHTHYKLIGLPKKESGMKTTKNRTLNVLKSLNLPYLYYEHENYFILLFNIEPNERKLSKDFLERYIPNYIEVNFVVTSESTKENIHDLYIECLDMMNFIREFKIGGIFTVEELGVFQLFTHMDPKFVFSKIPANLIKLQAEKPDLFETLYQFIDNNQNYQQTADELYLHAKTVRYRIEKIKELLELDFDNTMQILNYSVSIYILKLTVRK